MLRHLRSDAVKVGGRYGYPDMETLLCEVLDTRLVQKLEHEAAERESRRESTGPIVVPFPRRTGTA